MKLFYCSLLLLGVAVFAEERVKRQASYSFPGPRSDRGYRPAPNAAVYVEELDDREYPAPRRQFQAQPVQQPQYTPSQARAVQPPPAAAAPPAPAPQPQSAPVYEAPRPAAPAPRQSAPAARRRASTSSSNRANKYNSAPQQSLNAEDEEEQGPDPLTLLLQDSQFSCGGKTDGYYADDSVNCQVFHYCVGGAKHSWMCPENTVFHQVHLNCVPDAQDICAQSQKFHFVNDYLYKPVDYEGPNNTARYSQRYYPDGYVVGDSLVAPQEQAPRRPSPSPPQSYPASAPAPRPPPRQSAPAPPPQPTYRAPPQSSPAYRQAPASRPASRPSRPIESYPVEAPPQAYRPSAPAQAAPSPQAYQRPSQAQQAPRQPPPQVYRVVQQEPPSHSNSYSSEESPYQPQPQARRPSPPAQQARPTAGYAPPREQQYRPSARSAAGYPAGYSSNQAAGVQYDEDY